MFVEEAQRPLAIGKKGQNIHLATQLSGFELDMYNYEELPKFQAKLAEVRGEEVPVTLLVKEEDSGTSVPDVQKEEKAVEAESEEVKSEEQKMEEPAPAGSGGEPAKSGGDGDDASGSDDKEEKAEAPKE